MALFSSKNPPSSPPSPKATEDKAQNSVTVAPNANLAHVLKHARITEKATMHNEMGSYVFNVSDTATKREISQAIRKLYSVTPRMVRVVTVRSKIKRNMRTGKTGIKG